MHPLERVPAIRRLETDREDVFAIEIRGETTPADVENLYGLLEGAYELHERLDLLVRLVDVTGLDSGDISGETAATVHDHATRHVRRIAVVGDGRSARALTSIVEPDPPIEFRGFTPDEEPEAWQWIGAREIPESV